MTDRTAGTPDPEDAPLTDQPDLPPEADEADEAAAAGAETGAEVSTAAEASRGRPSASQTRTRKHCECFIGIFMEG